MVATLKFDESPKIDVRLIKSRVQTSLFDVWVSKHSKELGFKKMMCIETGMSERDFFRSTTSAPLHACGGTIKK
jgi:hypothetical protein